MPNCYTADIYAGKDVSLRDFLTGVGRGMSFSIMQRDSDPSEPVKLREKSTYSEDRLAEAKERLGQLNRMSEAEATQAALEDYEDAYASWVERQREKKELRERYDTMIAQVREWEPEEKIAYVKEYALKYLIESRDFDCGRPDEATRWDAEPTLLDGRAWLAQEIASAARDVEYHTEGVMEEEKRVEEFNEHINAFLRSLPDE